jgi:hypothetical protein
MTTDWPTPWRTRVRNAIRALRDLPPEVRGNPWMNPDRPGSRWYHPEGRYPLRPGEYRGIHPDTGEEVVFRLPQSLFEALRDRDDYSHIPKAPSGSLSGLGASHDLPAGKDWK